VLFLISHRVYRVTEIAIQLNYISFKIIQAAINVPKDLGPEPLESVLKDDMSWIIHTPSESI